MTGNNGSSERTSKPRPATKKKNSQPRSKLVEYMDRLVEELRTSLAKAFEGDIDAIHDSRVATRRLKAVLDLFEDHLSRRLKERFGKSLKRIRRTLGSIRDRDVMTEHIHSSKGIDAETAGFLLGCLKREREEELQITSKLNAPKMLGKLGNWWGLREEIQDELALSLLRESLSTRLEQFSRQADLHSGIQNPSEDKLVIGALNPHELRIIGKALRYTVEMAREEGVKIPAPVLRTFKRMQDLLGLWHDHVVLTSKVLEICVDEQLGYTQPALLKKTLAFAQTCARRAERRLNDFFVLWKKQGAALTSQIQAALDDATKAHSAIESRVLLEPASPTAT